MPSITPSLRFDNDLEEAAEFYMSVSRTRKSSTMSTMSWPSAAGSGWATWFVGVTVWIGYKSKVAAARSGSKVARTERRNRWPQAV